MPAIKKRLENVTQQIQQAMQKHRRKADSVKLLAVSKTRTSDEIQQAIDVGQRCFGESYIQEALSKIAQLQGQNIEWHFIGRIQGNKTRSIAENFDWVHSIDNTKQLRRLNEQRPDHLPPLNICLQVKIDNEESKAGLSPGQLQTVVQEMAHYPRLALRGFMTLPAPSDDLESQRQPFRKLRELRDQLATSQQPIETLSMGMSADLEAAIAEGATIVRIGTAIFGPRNYPT